MRCFISTFLIYWQVGIGVEGLPPPWALAHGRGNASNLIPNLQPVKKTVQKTVQKTFQITQGEYV